ncbi:MAG: hypothetical protein JO112_16160 [Planctomycetes bacterium]|nr:hypothetical protein [Planctomycetota bacterium]
MDHRPCEDYLDRDGLLSLGLDPEEADRVLARADLTGHEGRPVVDHTQLDTLLAEIRRDQP